MTWPYFLGCGHIDFFHAHIKAAHFGHLKDVFAVHMKNAFAVYLKDVFVVDMERNLRSILLEDRILQTLDLDLQTLDWVHWVYESLQTLDWVHWVYGNLQTLDWVHWIYGSLQSMDLESLG